MTLYEINEQFNALKMLLETGEIDEQTYQDTMSSLDADLSEKAENYAKIITEWQGDINTIKTETDRLQALKKRLEGNITRLKGNLLETMKSQKVQNIEAGTFKMFIRKNPPSVNITEETLIPDIYKITKTEISKKTLIEALKSGEVVQGAELVQGESLTIK